MEKAPLLHLLFVLVVLAAPTAARAQHMEEYIEKRQYMGTFVMIRLFATDEDEAGAAAERAFAEVEKVDRMMSTYREDSDLSRLNRQADGKPKTVPKELFYVIERAKAISNLTGGAFDVTVGPLIELWKSASKRGVPPTDEEIRQALSLVGYEKIVLDPETLTIAMPKGMSINLGGIAKGYAVDAASDALRASGIDAFLVDAGGDLFAEGVRPDKSRDWFVGIQDPFAGGALKVLRRMALAGRGAATSAHYYRYISIGERNYSHIIDPRTGRTVEEIAASVTVVAPNTLEADALATALSVLGAGRAEDLMEEVNSRERTSAYAALIITGGPRDYSITTTSRFEQYDEPASPRRMLIVLGLVGALIHTLFLARRIPSRRAGRSAPSRPGLALAIAAPYVVFALLILVGLRSG